MSENPLNVPGLPDIVELGQVAFSNTDYYAHEARWASPGLAVIAAAISEHRGITPDRYGYVPLLTDNSGEPEYENEVFAMRSYCWCDEDAPGHEEGCPPNFEHKPSGLLISWYKHAQRGITANQTQPASWGTIIAECLNSIPSPASPNEQ